jgi:hypothetical protein
MPGERMAARNFAGAGLLETLGRTLMCLQFGHEPDPGMSLIGVSRRKRRTTRNSDLDAELL